MIELDRSMLRSRRKGQSKANVMGSTTMIQQDESSDNTDNNRMKDEENETTFLLTPAAGPSTPSTAATTATPTMIPFPELSVTGTKLGEGGFCVVHEARWRDKRCALKFLRPDLTESCRQRGQRDLETEATILHRLHPGHDHIVQLWGQGQFDSSTTDTTTATTTSLTDTGEPVTSSLSPLSYIVLERLYDTIEDKLWPPTTQSVSISSSSSSSALIHPRSLSSTSLRSAGTRPTELPPSFPTRLRWALQVAKGLCFLHQQGILYRDLKPSNIALDEQNQVRLLDFGLAKCVGQDNVNPTLPSSSSTTASPLTTTTTTPSIQEPFKHTGQTGSWTYMAPEVAKGWAYNHTVDVYSFGILLWELSTHRVAYEQYDNEEIQRFVIRGDERPLLTPTLTEGWPEGLTDLMRSCWTVFAKKRPSMDRVVVVLEQMVQDLNDEEEQVRRRRKEAHGRRRHVVILPVAVLLVLLVVMGLIYWQYYAQRHHHEWAAAKHANHTFPHNNSTTAQQQ